MKEDAVPLSLDQELEKGNVLYFIVGRTFTNLLVEVAEGNQPLAEPVLVVILQKLNGNFDTSYPDGEEHSIARKFLFPT